MKLENKTILVLSSEDWGRMLLSKHHYAIELARKGNTVYFLNPPSRKLSLSSNFNYRLDESTKGVIVIDHRLNFPFDIKFHASGVYRWLMKWHTNKLIKSINKPVDLVWSFDLQGLYSLKDFPAESLKIYFPADEPIIPHSIKASQGANALVSITREIIDKFDEFRNRSYLLNHGLAAEFIGNRNASYSVGSPRRVSISGNFLRNDIDRATLLTIIKGNPDIIFECWGSHSVNHSNIGGSATSETEQFIDALKSSHNVIMHGIVDTATLAEGFNRMDAFLICYDIKKDHSKGTNYHKIMEYLSTGKVIISNNVTAYKDNPGLVEMVPERNNNAELPELFKKVMSSLDKYNSEFLIQKRRDFAFSNAYSNQIDKLEIFLHSVA